MSYPLASGPGGAGAQVQLPIAGRVGAKIVCSGISFSYNAAPTGGRFQMSGNMSGRGIDMDVTNAGVTFVPTPWTGYSFDPNEGVTLTLAGAGAAVVGKINVAVDYVPIE